MINGTEYELNSFSISRLQHTVEFVISANKNSLQDLITVPLLVEFDDFAKPVYVYSLSSTSEGYGSSLVTIGARY